MKFSPRPIWLAVIGATALILSPVSAKAVTLVWTGDLDGVSFYNSNNWIDQATGLPPTAGFISNNSPNDIDFLIGPGATIGGVNGVSSTIQIAPTGSLTMTVGSLGMNIGTNQGVVAGSGANRAPVVIGGDSQLSTQNVNSALLTVADQALVILDGGADPLSNSLIDLVGGGQILFSNIAPDRVNDEFLPRFTAYGNQVDPSFFILTASGNGTLLSVPEPGRSLLLAGTGLLLLARRRRPRD